MIERKKRSIAKAFTWRALATTITMLLVFLFTGEIELSLGIGVLDVLVKLLVYYLHERAWNRVRWGKHAKLKS